MNKLLTISLLLLVGFVFGTALNQAATANAERIVFEACNQSRLVIDGELEQRCGDLQDKYGIEFLCEFNNGKVSNRCWTEAK